MKQGKSSGSTRAATTLRWPYDGRPVAPDDAAAADGDDDDDDDVEDDEEEENKAGMLSSTYRGG